MQMSNTTWDPNKTKKWKNEKKKKKSKCVSKDLMLQKMNHPAKEGKQKKELWTDHPIEIHLAIRIKRPDKKACIRTIVAYHVCFSEY